MFESSDGKTTAIFDALVDGVYLIDEEFNIRYMNEIMIDEFGEGVGKKCHQLLHDSAEICPWCRAEEVFAGSSVRWEQHIEKKKQTYDIIEFPLKDGDGTRLKVSIFRDITKQKMDEARLRASEEDYRRLFEHVGCGVFISTRRGKFLDVNRALLDMLGYEDKEEFLTMNIARDLYLNPEDRKRFQELIERDGRVVNFEVYFKKKDGTPVPILLTAHARYDGEGNIIGYEGINVDQSERKDMEQKLKEANDFLNKIIQSSPNAIMATDLKGNIILWNRAAEEILGYGAEEVIGRMNIKKIYPEGMAKEVMRMIRSPEYGGKGVLRSYPMVHVRRDGQIIQGNLSAAMLYDSEGNEIASVGIFADLKEFLEMERKLGETQEKLLQSEKLAAMGKLTSQIAHELNNPLYGIMNTLELLKTEIPSTSKRRKILDMALSETVRLTEMLRKMLSFSRPEEEERRPTDINEILGEIMLLVGKQMQEHSIKVRTDFAPDLGMAYASRNQLRQVFLNMISNARDAMPEGGSLEIRTFAQEGNIVVEIKDTGTGIKEENKRRIFDAFFTTKDSVKDVGLGLSVCYGFIRDHGGDIRVSSEWGRGTTFTIVLPAMEKG
ncbi:MAG: PAS domain S-box protein [Deltaproteobacteria bacterium]|nr:PAS domain S-box protein [Deltaproteobacteria bacterium]